MVITIFSAKMENGQKVFEYVMEGPVLVPIAALGIIGNMISIIVYTRPSMRKSAINNILIGMLIFIIFYLSRVSNSDEPELELSGSSRAEIGSFRVEPGHFDFQAETKLNPNFFIIRSPVSTFQSILLSFI